MESIQDMIKTNDGFQKELFSIVKEHKILTITEDEIRDKITYVSKELDTLNTDYNNILEMYKNIVKSNTKSLDIAL